MVSLSKESEVQSRIERLQLGQAVKAKHCVERTAVTVRVANKELSLYLLPAVLFRGRQETPGVLNVEICVATVIEVGMIARSSS